MAQPSASSTATAPPPPSAAAAASTTATTTPPAAATIPEFACAPVREGLATVHFRNGEVFYNKVQAVNRDLSVLMVRDFAAQRLQERRNFIDVRLQRARDQNRELSAREVELNELDSLPGVSVLEGLSATGLRAIRYARELDDVVRAVVANDSDAAAVQTIAANVADNGVQQKVSVSHADVNELLRRRVGADGRPTPPFDVVDLDPYGSASPFTDAATSSVARSGLLCVTCTDGPVLCGNSPEVCLYRYGTMACKGVSFPHEMAVRMVLGLLQRDAARHGRSVEPLLSVFIDFYVRVFVRVFDGKAELRRAPQRVGMVYYCTCCHSFATQPLGESKNQKNGVYASRMRVSNLCDQCGSTYTLLGPVWLDELQNVDAVRRVYRSIDDGSGSGGAAHRHALAMPERVRALLRVVLEEVPHAPFYYNISRMCQVLKESTPSLSSIFANLSRLGYRASSSHTEPGACKTDAPAQVVWDILRCWYERRNSVSCENAAAAEGADGEHSVKRNLLRAKKLLRLEQLDFEARYTPREAAQRAKSARFPTNPTKFWGPGKRAAGAARREANADGGGADHAGTDTKRLRR